MERVWISAGGAGLGPLKHSWAGGGERNFPAHSVGDFSQLCFPVQGGHGLRHCLSSSWIKDLSVNHQSLINPHGFIAAFRDGCVGALSCKQNCSCPPERGMRRGGEDVGILFVLVSESGSSMDPAFCVLIPAFTFRKWKPSSVEQELLPCLGSLLILCSLRAEPVSL